jgi:hypothetical protein
MRSWQGLGKAETRLRKFELNLQLHAKPVKINVGKKEFMHITSELNTHLTQEQLARKYVNKAIGNYVYWVKINDFDDYEILGKYPIVAKYNKLKRRK